MSIERAEEAEEEPAAATLDSHFTTPYTAYEVLHLVMHEYGLEAYQTALDKAAEVDAQVVEINIPPVVLRVSLLREALERFNATHSPEEIREAAVSAQPNFGGAIGKLLRALSDGSVLVAQQPDEDGEEPPKTKLH